MSLRDYDKFTPKERRERAEGVTLRDPATLVEYEYGMVDSTGQRWRKKPGKDWERVVVEHAAEALTRKRPEAPPDTREDES